MTTPRDPDRLIRAYLDEGPGQLPDRTYDAVRSHIDQTRQRVVIGPWREPQMRTFLATALAAVAVVAVVIVGANMLLSRGDPGIGASAEPSASFEPSAPVAPTPTPATEPTGSVYTWPNALAAGTYTTSMIWDLPFAFTFTIGEGWTSRDVEIIDDARGISLMFARVANVYADPCAVGLMDPPVEPTVDGISAALAALPDVDATDPTPTSLAGYSGSYLEFSVGPDAGCGLSTYRLWTARSEWMRDAEHEGGVEFWAERTNYRVWVLDINGEVLLVAALSATGADAGALADLQAVLESIRFGPPVEATAIGDCRLELRVAGTSTALAAPYALGLGNSEHELLGVHPEEPDFQLPYAQLDFRLSDLVFGELVEGDRPGVGVIAPAGSSKQGFGTLMPDGEDYVGSFVLDEVGRWWIRMEVGTCIQQVAVDVGPAST
ncbi:MAG: hypothetical protein EPO36_07445 [Chloroflexota bacterium]|nr:MAG: hypothetical protein EPO36_07445 [Chloroflexota bacterium]